MQESGLTEMILFSMHFSYLGTVSCVCTSWVSSGISGASGCSLMAARRQVFFSFCVPSRLTSSHWRAVIADDCDILVYWYGRKYYIFQNHSLRKNKAQKQASWLSLWSRWYLEADTGHRPLTCRLNTEALQAAMPKIACDPRNVTNRTKRSPWQQSRGQQAGRQSPQEYLLARGEY